MDLQKKISPITPKSYRMTSMKQPAANTFFSIENYVHRALFKEEHYVWEALLLIENYICAYASKKIEVEVPSSAFLVHPELISIGKGTRIEPGAYIAGPCLIGENCEIRQGAYIRGNVITGNQCVIGHATEVKNAIFLDHVHAAHFNYVGDSILGNRVNLGAGAVCANYRLDHRDVPVFFNGQKIQTNLKKLGAVIGDDAQICCNYVLNPGALIEKHAQIFD